MIEEGNGKLSPIQFGFAPLSAISKENHEIYLPIHFKDRQSMVNGVDAADFPFFDIFGGEGRTGDLLLPERSFRQRFHRGVPYN